MALSSITSSPTSGTEADGTVTLSAHFATTGGWTTEYIKIYYRINGGTWLNTTLNYEGTSITHTRALCLAGGGDTVEWYWLGGYYEGAPGIGLEFRRPTSSNFTFSTPVDATGPTISDRVPADAGTVYPGASGCQFTATIYDAFFVNNTKLYLDADVLKDTETGSASTLSNAETFLATGLTKGAHTWYLTATDEAGNATTSSVYDVTVGNVVPTAPGTPSCEGLSVVSVGTEYSVTWSASTDLNTEDTITYDLEVKYGAAAWGNVAADIAGLSQAWTPSTAGAAYLRVHAKDGTGDSAYSGTKSLTVDETDPPNAPTLTAPTGAETWEEGETQNVTWTKASPEHPDALVCTYEGEFSKGGAFGGDEISLFSGSSGTSYAWTLATTLVAADTATCKVRVRARDSSGKTSAWSTSAAGFDVLQNTVPTVALVSPTDAGNLQKTATTTFTFLVDDVDDDPAHVELQVSEFADFRSYVISQDTSTDYASWEESETPFATWTTMTSAGGTHDYRVRYVSSYGFRYDTYYGRVRVSDNALTSAWTTFSFTIIADPTAALIVTIGGNTYDVTALVITENTGGEASPISMALPLGAYLDEPFEAGDAVTVASGLGGHARSWNATLETWSYSGTMVDVYCLQDDAYLSRKLATGNEASADLGANLRDFVDDYGAPLDEDNIDATILASIALTGGYKTLREHFNDAMKMAPNYVLWVDSAGSVHFIDQTACTGPLYELYEEDPT